MRVAKFFCIGMMVIQGGCLCGLDLDLGLGSDTDAEIDLTLSPPSWDPPADPCEAFVDNAVACQPSYDANALLFDCYAEASAAAGRSLQCGFAYRDLLECTVAQGCTAAGPEVVPNACAAVALELEMICQETSSTGTTGTGDDSSSGTTGGSDTTTTGGPDTITTGGSDTTTSSGTTTTSSDTTAGSDSTG